MRNTQLAVARPRSVRATERQIATQSPLCGICFAPGHPTAECPFLIYSANFEQQANVSSYAEAAKSAVNDEGAEEKAKEEAKEEAARTAEKDAELREKKKDAETKARKEKGGEGQQGEGESAQRKGERK